ncbi:hypothetical protein LOZ53_002796 [Ophidiomyces ophidiicola]|uniref:Uncharacterized protein n=1 Tax=Ophidiomyces ophidiicola TaxID=1387563 RepID=A0ACB8US24_9EURO|nr:uncharacterized protein LOZ57_003644 [Ophidiomyces ophidiicola]KAI1917073.1 hypothetical protein LOZ61_000590 [Ophidiomyces ophidiicola]KAI1922622.1 hypothetical protein LOZ64_001180 [Ophidiomyces ophidiicola]KAI1927662.1 hypothetical protein LOZ60_002921 [Ophidiomyces ophidiicola]KAI1946389.1 hypothetical protein LOZ57_003644 [Ophidiomyces ophidiicola]KAI1949973.1 hypothetical protein LOZ62_002143 [Ophidiomyces ophidiicola]
MGRIDRPHWGSVAQVISRRESKADGSTITSCSNASSQTPRANDPKENERYDYPAGPDPAFKPEAYTTIDGQPPKRRGPKPDSKPAQTRRQELNRQAQRTHRERKEQYIRTLEVEISRLREGYANDITTANASIHQHRQNLEAQREENRILREILTTHGINVEVELDRRRSPGRAPSQASYQESSAPSQTTSYPNTKYVTPDTTVSSGRSPIATGAELVDAKPGSSVYSSQAPHTHYGSELGVSGDIIMSSDNSPVVADMPGVFDKEPHLEVEFILTLEGTCRDHIERLCRRAHDDEEQDVVAGHILMATCPPPSEVALAARGHEYPVKTYDLPPANLNTLLNLSRQLVTDNEITPIMALQSLKDHEMYHLLTKDDVRRMMDDLLAKVRCYGFGAVLEDFEFRDALNGVLGSKLEFSATQAGCCSHIPLRLNQAAEDYSMYS